MKAWVNSEIFSYMKGKKIMMLRKQNKTFAEISFIINRSETAYKQSWYKF